jgi:hypothetical protein
MSSRSTASNAHRDGAGDGLHQRHHCEDLFRSASGPADPDPVRSGPSYPDPFRTEALRPDAGTDLRDVEQTTVAPAVEGTAVVPQTDFTPPLDIPAGGTDAPGRRADDASESRPDAVQTGARHSGRGR